MCRCILGRPVPLIILHILLSNSEDSIRVSSNLSSSSSQDEFSSFSVVMLCFANLNSLFCEFKFLLLFLVVVLLLVVFIPLFDVWLYSGVDCDMIFVCSPLSDISCDELICIFCCGFIEGFVNAAWIVTIIFWLMVSSCVDIIVLTLDIMVSWSSLSVVFTLAIIEYVTSLFFTSTTMVSFILFIFIRSLNNSSHPDYIGYVSFVVVLVTIEL